MVLRELGQALRTHGLRKTWQSIREQSRSGDPAFVTTLRDRFRRNAAVPTTTVEPAEEAQSKGMTLEQMKEYWAQHSVAGHLLQTGELPEGVDASATLPEAATQRLVDLVGQFAQQQGRFTAGDLAALFTESAQALRPLSPALAPDAPAPVQE